ncbi:unnamed protein product [Eruca vesicaria subsp. sativa]|uniref:Polycomb protein VEFS-Box domain-containing protein n=1 Tax=Eruca vesicaria subsp. sativa TaxID=29727 RepID=A0ABC8LL87_ERUVS|nr:unnamed protein product [Eruca vesicaria subsp. sativa]
MTLEEVLSDADSKIEDEDLKDEQERIKLDRLDVSDEEKRFMWLCNTYVRRKSEFTDEHVPLACEEFVKLHAKELILPKFICQWIEFTITLWNYGLICAKTMDKCSIILQNAREEEEEAAAAAKEEPSAEAAEAAASTSMGTIRRHKKKQEAASNSKANANGNDCDCVS